jgi:DinB family protein
VDDLWKDVIWQQFGAAIDTLENALLACPEELWSDRSRRPEFWYLVYHTLFFLDLYLSESVEGFVPPMPFTLDELDPAGRLPERPYTKDELHTYLQHGRKKCQAKIQGLTDEKARQRCRFEWLDVSGAELLLYNLRHVQHHAAQLNLILRQTIDSAPGWVARAKARAEMDERLNGEQRR